LGRALIFTDLAQPYRASPVLAFVRGTRYNSSIKIGDVAAEVRTMSAGGDGTTNGTPEDGRGGVASPDEDIVAQVMAAAEQVETLDDECRLLLLSILTGDDDLQAELTGRAVDRPAGRMPKAPAKEPAGAYLKSIIVAGFRGIGPEARLDLHPAPGVVVVAGRNGSGKSTFSEAVEVALTRTSYRWEAKKGASGWRAGWRNLHASDPCHIRVELAEEGVGTTTVAADLAEATKEPRDGAFWVQQAGRQRDSSLDPLGWVRPLELYRPLLSYDELGGILDAPPSQLYEKLSTILGLGRIATAQERLDELVKSATAPRREAKAQVARLREALAASQDPRATEAAQLLTDRVPDTEALERLATGAIGPPSGDMAILRELAALTVPTVEQVQAAVTEAEEAQHVLAALSGDAAEVSAMSLPSRCAAARGTSVPSAPGLGCQGTCRTGGRGWRWTRHTSA
jgi:energy-coupling factor transporter ATP-binding protein EcfA2